SISRMASAGDTHDVLATVQPTWAEDEFGAGPSGRAVRTGKTQISKDIAGDPLYQSWGAELVRQGCVSSIALPLLGEGGVFGILHVYAEEVDAFTGREISLLEEMAADLAFGVQSLRIRQERDRAMQLNEQHLTRMREALQQTIVAIARAVEARDPYTAGHQRRVAELACAIAGQMGLDEERVEGIRMGGTIHDIGKIQVPSEILTKPTRLTEIEYQIIKEHPRVGYEILKDIHFPWPVAEIARQHHERMDGSGYPQGLKGDDICLEARIVAVADVVEAMSSYRPYRPGLGIEAALAEIRKTSGTFYDAQVVDACLALFAGGYQFD
ncbi:MAG: HD domain-containing phosphohydrolase, partial [Gammaproteobacteria bacterium]